MRDQNRFEKEKEQISSKGEDSYKRLRKAERELEDTKEDRLRLLSKISDLDHALKLSNEAITRLTAKYDSDKAMISERSDSQVSDLTTKLETVTEAHARTCRELQQLLSEQRRMAERWKDESTQMASHYEALLTDSKTQTQRYIQRVEELEALNERLSVTKKELLAQVTDEKKSHARIQGLLYNLESKNETVVKQLHELMEREKDWAEEKRRLQRSIDRIQLEKERERRDRTKEIALSNHMSSKTAPIIRDLQETVQSDEREFGEHELRALKSDLQRVKKRAHSNNIAELNDLILTMDSDSDLE
ncbi:uncharacterized protein BJ171DRAFT_223053 [Polychytrium aggregatum]|uniref:uncharacterized protein n=1 Tax=Polychytrium aggregatum TaxID=110093 RepID=UPI0022FE31BE|nr:uncharacterized protein BJ171DRAFT_223053 [Polychytrium aggregatum]KAI9197357.1 hypothetical protein BJ171DRAFT_223053 [Polychytrium aggregatum]